MELLLSMQPDELQADNISDAIAAMAHIRDLLLSKRPILPLRQMTYDFLPERLLPGRDIPVE